MLEDAVKAHRDEPIDEIVDRVLVRFGLEILKIVPGRVSTEVDARLSLRHPGQHRACAPHHRPVRGRRHRASSAC